MRVTGDVATQILDRVARSAGIILRGKMYVFLNIELYMTLKTTGYPRVTLNFHGTDMMTTCESLVILMVHNRNSSK